MILDKLKALDCSAVIFDLDGTLLDNNPFHLKAWKRYLEGIGREMTEKEFNEKLNGRTNKDVVQYLYGTAISGEEIWQHTMEKEKIYREIYQPHIRPVSGLLDLLQLLDDHGIPMAIATSGVEVNINFMFDHVPIRKYFKAVVDSSFITHGKPDPEIFLKAAALLDTPPAHCLVFEDALVGIQAARAAGMKVIAISTTEKSEALATADLVIADYSELL